jgi:hypothetical protein
MSCACECHNTVGHRINRRASIGARLVELRDRIQETEKQARRTPPKTLVAEKQRVENAKATLPFLHAERDALLVELAGLAPGVANPRNDSEGSGT